MTVWKEGDEIVDLALLSFKKRKEEVFGIIDAFVTKLDPQVPIVVNAGDFPPDAAYSVYYDYFFNKMTFPYTAMGTYIKVHGERLKERFKFMSTIQELTYEPQYQTIDYKKYPKVDGKIKASIRASAGCPRRCVMCPVPLVFDNKYRYFTPINVANQIKKLYEEGIRYFTFIDDNLSHHPDFIKLLLELRKLKLKGVKFHCQEGFDLGTFDMKRARLLKRLNFDDVKIAFESIIPRTTNLINKSSINSISIQQTVDIIKEVGLKVKAFMLLGLDETEEEVIENLSFFARNNMTLRINIVREYGSLPKEITASRMDDKKLKSLKALAYASSFYTEQFGLNLFDADGEEFERKTGLIYDHHGCSLEGKTKYGFRTSRLEKGIKWFFNRDIESNDGEQIILSPPRDIDNSPRVSNKSDDMEEVGEAVPSDDEGESDSKSEGFTAEALAKSREIRKEFMAKFGVEGKVPTSILIHDRKEYRYETIDLSAQRRGGNYVHHYRINRQKMHERDDYTPGLEKTGFETQGRTGYISGFPQNVGRFIIQMYCPDPPSIIYDPFAGHNSRMQLCFKTGHHYIGVDCCHEFMEDNKAIKEMLYERKKQQIVETHDQSIWLFEQSSESVPTVKDEMCDFTITSPPYWDLEYYGPEEEQLGTGKKYEEFLDGIERVIKENYRVLKPGAFCAWFINDFRKKKKFYPYHSHIYEILTNTGFEGFNIYIVDLGATVNHMFVQDILNHKILPKRHEYCVLVKKPQSP
jgi:DNA modification methylase